MGCTQPVAAQTAAIVGVAKDTGGAPIPFAEAVLVRAKRAARATDRGWFVFDSVTPGPDLLLVRALGYEPQSLPVSLNSADTVEVEVTLSVLVQVLPELSVEAYGRQFVGVAAEAARRLLLNGAPASGLITRDDFEKWGVSGLGQAMRRAGLLVSGDRASCPIRAGGAAMSVYVDGAIFQTAGQGIDVAILPPSEIEAIEVYRSVATRPVEFNTTNAAGCLVLIWTRRGS